MLVSAQIIQSVSGYRRHEMNVILAGETRQTMCVQHYIVAHLCNHYCHGTATVCSLFIVVTCVCQQYKMFIVAVEMKQVIFFALLST
jgi:hypothetical protein